MDKLVKECKIGYYLKCKNFRLIYLRFFDDILVFIDGNVRCTDSIVEVFDSFVRMLGLRISMEKLIIYY